LSHCRDMDSEADVAIAKIAAYELLSQTFLDLAALERRGMGVTDTERARLRADTTPEHWCDRLDRWMTVEGLCQSDVARLVGCGPSSVSTWIVARRPPGNHYRREVERASCGAVPASLPPRGRAGHVVRKPGRPRKVVAP
jgi:hypothetical protein